jgi:hypothetical protein
VGVVDRDKDHHGAASVRLDAGERMDGDGQLTVVRGEPLRLLIHHFDDEELLAVLAVARREEFITLEAFVVLATLSDLRRREPHEAGRRLVDRSR